MASARTEIAELVPANALVVGDVAPALCMDSKIQAIPMQPGLSNDTRPLETLKPYAIALVRSTTWDNGGLRGIQGYSIQMNGLEHGPSAQDIGWKFSGSVHIRQRNKP